MNISFSIKVFWYLILTNSWNTAAWSVALRFKQCCYLPLLCQFCTLWARVFFVFDHRGCCCFQQNQSMYQYRQSHKHHHLILGWIQYQIKQSPLYQIRKDNQTIPSPQKNTKRMISAKRQKQMFLSKKKTTKKLSGLSIKQFSRCNYSYVYRISRKDDNCVETD